jgi:hypothetical protein
VLADLVAQRLGVALDRVLGRGVDGHVGHGNEPDDGRDVDDAPVFERLEDLEPAQGFRGCPFVAAAVQLKSPEHPASLVARQQKDALTSFFQHEADRAGAPDPAQLARQLTLVFDGASARSVVQARGLDGLAVATAAALLDGAGVNQSGASHASDG